MGRIASDAQPVAGIETAILPASSSPTGSRRTLCHPVGDSAVVVSYIEINEYVWIPEAKVLYHAIYGDGYIGIESRLERVMRDCAAGY